jgi:ferredoxin-NADP reductase
MALTQTLLRSRALASLASPHGVDRYLELINPMWAATEVRARVVSVTRENPLSQHAPVATLVLEPTRTWKGHLAGQHVTVGLEIPGAKRMNRCFSISSPASSPGERITLTIRRNDDGEVSKRLVEAVPGQLLHLSQAEGDFVLPGSPATPSPHPLVLITGGSGITPAMSMVRTLLRDGYDGHAGRKVHFLHFARSRADQIFAAELNAIARAENGVEVYLHYGEEVFTEARLQALVPGFREIATYACGPEGMIDLVQQAYSDSSSLHVEYFKVPTAASASAGGTLRFAVSDAEVPNTGGPILEQAEAAGLTPDSGCRMGICFSCVARKTDGRVLNVLTGAESDLPDEDIRICVSAPMGNYTINL